VIAMMFWYGGHWAFWQVGLAWVGMLLGPQAPAGTGNSR
jgi:hypothetical protein